MSDYRAATLAAGESTDWLVVTGQCDLWASEVTGEVQLELLFPGEQVERSVPGESYSEDTFKTVFVSEYRVKMRLTCVSGTAYARVARGLNS